MKAVEAGLSARRAGLASCRSCGTLHRIALHDAAIHCRRCDARVHSRTPHSLQRTWAFLIAGVLAYVPAMVLPVMITRSFTDRSRDTIMSGVMELAGHGSLGIALIVFVASICIPAIKFVTIATLALSLQLRWTMSDHTRQRLHLITEFIGRWSMIDVFVLAVLTGLIQLGAFMTILPGQGIQAFAVSVVFTMLAASSLDPRLFWDRESDERS